MTQTCSALPYIAPRRGRPSGRNCFTEDGRGAMRAGEILFIEEPFEAQSADWLFVGMYPYSVCFTDIPRERRILFLIEPPAIKNYESDYLEQFGIIVSPYAIEGYTGRVIVSNPCVGWFAGANMGIRDGNTTSFFKSLRDVREYRCPAKTRTLSAVISLKNICGGHAKRLTFLKALQARYGTKLDSYGRGFNAVDDKLDAIAPYKYHIAIENCQLENYWTEKLADAWIGWSLPIYCGDPAIRDRIPDPLGIEIIDIDDIPSSLKKIDYILENDVYDSRVEAIKKCRDWVIAESNPYERVCRIIESADKSTVDIPKLDERVPVLPPMDAVHISYFIFKFLSSLFGGRAWYWYIAYKNYKRGLRLRKEQTRQAK